jgi:hypothetical protein
MYWSGSVDIFPKNFVRVLRECQVRIFYIIYYILNIILYILSYILYIYIGASDYGRGMT